MATSQVCSFLDILSIEIVNLVNFLYIFWYMAFVKHCEHVLFVYIVKQNKKVAHFQNFQ